MKAPKVLMNDVDGMLEIARLAAVTESETGQAKLDKVGVNVHLEGRDALAVCEHAARRYARSILTDTSPRISFPSVSVTQARARQESEPSSKAGQTASSGAGRGGTRQRKGNSSRLVGGRGGAGW